MILFFDYLFLSHFLFKRAMHEIPRILLKFIKSLSHLTESV